MLFKVKIILTSAFPEFIWRGCKSATAKLSNVCDEDSPKDGLRLWTEGKTGKCIGQKQFLYLQYLQRNFPSISVQLSTYV